MNVLIENGHRYFCQLRADLDLSSLPLASDDATASLAELLDETYNRGVLADRFPADVESIRVAIRPIWAEPPLVARVQIELTADNGQAASYWLEFEDGPWVRQSLLRAQQLRAEDSLGPGQRVYRALVAVPSSDLPPLALPPLQAPAIHHQSLEDFGVRRLGAGELVPDRPVLVNARLVDEAIRSCEEAGLNETGGAVLGKILCLGEPLPGTTTRIVTVLSAAIEDPRHVGGRNLFTCNPDALAEAARIGEIRGLGESVVTVYHTHGWSPSCRRCNQNAQCPLVECSPSLQDYTFAAALFPSKSALMPIVGRKLGEQGEHPVFRIHAWRGGEMRAIRWQAYHD